MKRRDLIRHLEANGCRLLREGGSHSIWKNPKSGKRTAVPRHNEITEYTAIKICKQLEIPNP
ncbi:MAG: type II toxin-antitoxin system HicA family toxin [Acidobacteria bacterium]|nr:type II toxin-antitoxin system HicA family toxin [Acidobacteriota bacterium]